VSRDGEIDYSARCQLDQGVDRRPPFVVGPHITHRIGI